MNPKTLVWLAAFAAAPAFAATEPARLALPVDADSEVSVENVAGEMTIVGGDGAEIVVEVERVGATAELARSVVLKHTVDGDRIEIWLEYPSDEIVYRRGEGGSYNSTFDYRGERVEVSSRGDGDEVHANVRVTVPRGTELRAFNAAGGLNANGVHGELALRTASGRIGASGGSGEWALRSGSGRVSVTHFSGELAAHTGSGRIILDDVEGRIEAETGSGRIVGESVGGELDLSTGSGRIELEGVMASGEFDASTGSGSIHIAGDLSRVTELEFSTGSGSIRVDLDGAPNFRLVARTGSGSIEVDVPNMRDVLSKRGRFEATLGNGEGSAELHTGSGSIRVNAN